MLLGITYYYWVNVNAVEDGKEIVIIESSVRRDLQLADEEAIDYFPNSIIFKQLTLMRKPKRMDTQVLQPSGLTESVADKVVHKELGDSLVRAATTASSLEAEVESSDNKESLGKDASKQEKRIDVIDSDEDITLVSVQDDTDNKMFDLDDLDNGKGIMIEEPMKPKKKDQIMLDKEAALMLQAKFDEEERLARERERAKKEQEANIALIETWDDIQAKIDADHQLAKRLQAQE
uniref:Uncharacterized protein n=1 Tax=Tanacetum cinerariifolium TaxID=118510 RepID=A0A6L2LGA0_TANCI|nr:hypothetical protein [Tanacetum cinerariifolium]